MGVCITTLRLMNIGAVEDNGGAAMGNGIASIPRYQTGGSTRREFLKRLARTGLGAFLSQNLPGMGGLPTGIDFTDPRLREPRGWLTAEGGPQWILSPEDKEWISAESAIARAKREARRQARMRRQSVSRAVDRAYDTFDPSYNRPGILDSPSVRPSPSTAGRWGMRGLRGLGGALGMGLGTAVDVFASPTELGSGDLPESPRFTDEEMEIIRDKQRQEFQAMEDLLGPRLPIGLEPRPNYPTIGPRRASGGIIGLRRAA